MVARVTDIDDDADLTIQQTCVVLGIHRNTLRKYTHESRIAVEVRAADGKQFYKGCEIKRFANTRI